MPLKAVLATKAEVDALPEAVRAFYKEDAGTFVLDVDGMVGVDVLDAANLKVSEFRTNNIALTKRLDALKDVDPAEFTRLKTAEAKWKETGVKDPGDIEARIAKAIETATTPLTKTLESLTKERDEAKAAVATKELQDELWQVGVKAGVRDEAKGFWLAEATKQFKKDDSGALVAFKGDQPILSKKKGNAGNPLTAEEWALEVAPLDPSLSLLYKGSTGSGAKPHGQQGQRTDGVRVLPNDAQSISANLEAIASGKAVIHSAA